MASVQDSPLGGQTRYPSEYDPALLYPIARADSRRQLPGAGAHFYGADLWTAYELSWLDERGLPQVAIMDVTVPADSECIVESKSFKLYLNSFNQVRLPSAAQLEQTIREDLTKAVGAPVDVVVRKLASETAAGAFADAKTLDDQLLTIEHYHPNPDYLQADPRRVVTEAYSSDLLKTNCPVTGQPDWASLWVSYTGPAIDPAGLLRYIVSFREHQDFHEHCVERIFTEISQRCQPQQLAVYARYTRRGGLDINPYRASEPGLAEAVRLVRQ